jgi:predicted nucleic acid-binding Zn ribbon protein
MVMERVLGQKAYELSCKSCGWSTIVITSIIERCLPFLEGKDESRTICPECGGKLERNDNAHVKF